LTPDDAFLSPVHNGILVYRIPAPHTLVGVSQESFYRYTTMSFILSVQAVGTEGAKTMRCGNESKCRLTYHRHYTPVLNYMNPPIVYYDALVEVNFNPYYIMTVIKELQPGDLPFINVKIGNTKINFEDHVDHETGFSGW